MERAAARRAGRGRQAAAISNLGLRVPGALLAALTLAACSGATSTYFDQPSSAAESGAIAPGTVAFAGVGGPLEVRPGDHVRLLGLEAGADVSKVLIGLSDHGSANYAVARATEMQASDLAGYEPLGDREFSSADGPLTILLEVTMPSHDVNIVAPVLTFTVNDGGPQRERLLTSVRLCARSFETDPCDTPDPPAR